MSRLPIGVDSPNKHPQADASIIQILQIGVLPVKPEEIRLATTRDPALSKVLQYTQQEWPSNVEADLKPYFQRQTELSVEAGCLMWGIRVIVPKKLQKAVLTELHTSHPGIVKMKSLARTHVWWPGIDKEIEQVAQQCEPCQGLRNKPQTTTLHPWNWPARPWQRIHVDFAGPFMGSMFFIVVDAHSKWLEVIPMHTTTTAKTITELRKLFA